MGQHYRRVHVDSETWLYFVGKQNVSIRNPLGSRRAFPLAEVLGLSVPSIQTMQEEGSLQITPQQVKDFISKKKGTFTKA